MTINPTGNNFVRYETTGEQTLPLQCAFFAYLAAGKTNVTGNGAQYTIPFDSELFDRNSDFNTATGVFVAPVDGIYFVEASVLFADSVNKNSVYCDIYNSTTTSNLQASLDSRTTSTADMHGRTCGLVSLSAGDNVIIRTQVFGSGANDADLSAAIPWTHFCGHLVC